MVKPIFKAGDRLIDKIYNSGSTFVVLDASKHCYVLNSPFGIVRASLMAVHTLFGFATKQYDQDIEW